MADITELDIDNVRYSFDTQEYFQRQVEVALNEYIQNYKVSIKH